MPFELSYLVGFSLATPTFFSSKFPINFLYYCSMKKLLLILLCLPFIGFGQQTDYELEFDSAAQDYVEILNMSSYISNKTAFSISGWLYLKSNAINTIHSGFMGFRNDLDADFYLLQLDNTSDIEARFRNSSGTKYDIIVINGLSFNQWQHLAFTYDGSYIRLYKNGFLLDSTAANGVITQTNQSLRLGSLDWQGTEFHMSGRLDEIRLWDVTISQPEINNWMCTEVNSFHPDYNNLIGYWRLNTGFGVTIYDQINGNNGMFINSPIWNISTSCLGSNGLGCTDTLACNYDSLATIDDGTCGYNSSSYDTLSVNSSIVWNGMSLNVSGDYSITLFDSNSVGCDSIVNLNLTVTTTGISDITNNKSNLVKVTDMLGQETPYRRNTPLFYIYDDGTVEKKIIFE